MNERLEQLLNNFSLDALSEEEVRELEELLQDPQNRAHMVDFFNEENAIRDFLQEEKASKNPKKIKTNRHKLKTVRKARQKKKRSSVLPFMLATAAAVILGLFVYYAQLFSVGKPSVLITEVSGNSNGLRTGDKLLTGRVIETGKESSIHFKFGDDTKVIISANSKVKIGSIDQQKKLEVIKGNIVLDVQKQAQGAPLLVLSDKAVATVKGTILEVGVNQAGTRLDVYEGLVNFQRKVDSKSVDVSEGEFAKTTDADLNSRKRVGNKNDFIAYWDFDNAFNNQVKDISGNISYSKIDGAQRTSGYQRSSMNFDGKDAYIDVGDIRLSEKEVTVSAWVNVKNLQGIHEEGRIISKSKGIHGEEHFFMMSIYPSEQGHGIRFRLRTNNKTATLTSPPTNIPLNEWMHVVGTYDGKRMKVYKNGELLDFMNKQGPINVGAGIRTWIGGNPTGKTDRPFAGKIDEVRIYKKALSEQEVKELYLGTR